MMHLCLPRAPINQFLIEASALSHHQMAAAARLLVELSGIDSIEGDPKEIKASIKVFRLFGPINPAQGTVNS